MRATPPPLIRVVRPGVFYGWYVAFACLVLMLVTVGVSYYGLSLFLKPLRDEHGWSNAVVSGATGTFFVVSGAAGFVAGPWIDRLGPRRFMAAGIVMTGAAASSIGWVTEIWHLYAAYSVMAIAYGLGAIVPVSTLMARWFILDRGKATMISSTGVSLGGAMLVPLGALLIDAGGLELAAPVLGVIVVAVALPTLWLAIAESPQSVGLEPDGGRPARATSRVDVTGQYRVWTRTEAMRTRTFWAATAGFFLALGATTGVLIYQLAFLQEPDRLGSRSAAALAVTVTTIGSIGARGVVGLIADRLDKRLMASTLFAFQALAICGYIVVHHPVLIYIVALLFGFTIGNVYLVQSLLIGELFGLVSFGTVFGMIALASQIGSGLALIAVGSLVDAHGYGAPFFLMAALDVVAAIAILGAKRPGLAPV